MIFRHNAPYAPPFGSRNLARNVPADRLPFIAPEQYMGNYICLVQYLQLYLAYLSDYM
jgi:hypothetical protein